MARRKMDLDSAFHEVFTDVPKSVKRTGKTGKAKRKMMIAIALSKAGVSRPGKIRKGI